MPIKFSDIKKIKKATNLSKPLSVKEIKKPVVLMRRTKPPVAKISSASFDRVKVRRIFLPLRYSLFGSFAIIILLCAYLSGIWTGLTTSKSYAEFVFSDTGSLIKQTSADSLTLQVMPLSGSGQLPVIFNEENLFSMPLKQLEETFVRKQQQMTEAMFDIRSEKIRIYLEEKKSPFAEFAPVIARQNHWRLILGIAFAESSWGKNCVDNNCSNIGVKPGHELWHEYKNYGEWIADFNQLLERRYKDWSLDDMCGVYVKPCNQNWLLATKQVLQELESEGIE